MILCNEIYVAMLQIKANLWMQWKILLQYQYSLFADDYGSVFLWVTKIAPHHIASIFLSYWDTTTDN